MTIEFPNGITQQVALPAFNWTCSIDLCRFSIYVREVFSGLVVIVSWFSSFVIWLSLSFMIKTMVVPSWDWRQPNYPSVLDRIFIKNDYKYRFHLRVKNSSIRPLIFLIEKFNRWNTYDSHQSN